MRYLLCIDVGGTQIKSAVLDENGAVLGEIRYTPSMAEHSAEVILQNFEEIAAAHAQKAAQLGISLNGVRLAFPGPFDYKNGICQIKGLGKYAALYGVNLRKELAERFSQNSSLAAAANSVMFINDVAAFALGELRFGDAKAAQKAMFICIGTGCGSAFAVGGKLIYSEKDAAGVPKDGYVYPAPFKGSCVDDYISRRGLEALSEKHLGKPYAGKELAQLAANGSTAAKDAFAEFGALLKEALAPFLQGFKPDMLCLGGQLMASESLFLTPLRECCGAQSIKISITLNTSLRAMQGLLSL